MGNWGGQKGDGGGEGWERGQQHTFFTRQFACKGSKISIFVPQAADTLFAALESATPEFSEMSECWTNSRGMLRCCMVAFGIPFGRAVRDKRRVSTIIIALDRSRSTDLRAVRIRRRIVTIR